MARHTNAEITAKLAQANAMEAGGATQAAVARALGISVMTLHRWRKKAISVPGSDDRMKLLRSPLIAELELENSRLRKLVADLMLEKMKLEEAIKK